MMPDKATIDRTTFDRLFGNTLEAIRRNDFGRIFKDVVGSRRGGRAVSVWATGTGSGLTEMSIDTGYTVERHGELRFSQGEGCLELAIYFDMENDLAGTVELATRGGLPVPPDDVGRHVRAVAKAFDMVLRDQLPPARLVPAPTVPFRLWATSGGDYQAHSWPAETPFVGDSPASGGATAGLGAEYGREPDVAELWSQLRTLIEQQKQR